MIKTPLSTVIGGAGIWTPGCTVIGGQQNINQLIKSLFADGTQGIYLNAQDALSVSDLSSIKDLSGRNNHAAQPNATSRASLITDASGYKSLKFDGIDDGYVTPPINFTNTDSVTVIAAVRKLSDSSQGILTELGNAVSNYFIAHVGGGNGIESYTFGSRGNGLYSYAILTKSANPTLTAPHSSVVSAKSDISSNISYIKANGRAITNSIDQGGGTYGNLPLFIGRRGGTQLPFNGQIYALLVIGKLLDDATTAKIEKEFAKYIGVTL